MLFGKGLEENNWQCLQVACSKDIKGEIIDVINFILSYDYDELLSSDDGNKIIRNTQFFENVYEVPEEVKDKRKYTYSKVGRDYSQFKICVLDVEKYLDITSFERILNQDINNIVEIAKNRYAEAKLAYETLPVYWNAYRSGIDQMTITMFLEMNL